MKEEPNIHDQIKNAYVMYHSPWIEEGEKDYWWKQIQILSKKRAEQ